MDKFVFTRNTEKRRDTSCKQDLFLLMTYPTSALKSLLLWELFELKTKGKAEIYLDIKAAQENATRQRQATTWPVNYIRQVKSRLEKRFLFSSEVSHPIISQLFLVCSTNNFHESKLFSVKKNYINSKNKSCLHDISLACKQTYFWFPSVHCRLVQRPSLSLPLTGSINLLSLKL